MTESVELVVATSTDADRDVARLPEAVRRRLGVLSGDSVIVEGNDPIVATVWPASVTLSDDSVALSRRARDRAGVDPGDTVYVRRAAVDDATAMTVEAPERVDESSIEDAVTSVLEDRPVTVGDTLRVGGDPVRVVDVRPGGTVRITPATSVRVRPVSEQESPVDSESVSGVAYQDIGGLEEELELVREAVELPLTEPELFDRLGIEPPTGVLLYGPPGTGKTLIAEAVANAGEATFYHVSGPEITSKYKGESEERLREVFERARETAPSIVFFDEIDAVAAERDDDGDMENRVVAQLLSLMDGLEARGDVVVIGATNRVDTLDPALRRPGRFDREIEIGVPDEQGRRDVLAIHARDVPLSTDVDLDDLAARTHGFVGADLRALLTEAAMVALRRVRESDGDRDSLEVTHTDLETALASIEPSAMREFVAETPDTGFDDIGGLDAAKDTLREAVEWPLSHPGLFDATATDPPSGILLYGPPGTGKTLLARAVATESEVNFVHVAGPELVDKYVGESEKAVRDVFDRARQAAPSIVFFDEIDAIAARRQGDSDVTERVVSQLLTELDGLADNPGLVVLAATNRREAIDPALLRPGRLETHVEVPLPDRDARRAILDIHTREKPLAGDVDLDALAAELEGASGADIEALVRAASMRAIREVAASIGADAAEAKAADIEIEARHFEAARDSIDGVG